MTGSQVKDFTKGNITKQIFTFAAPLFLSNLLQVVYNMVDIIVVGHVLGKVGTSSVAVGGDITNFLTFLAIGFSSAGQVLIARYVGSRQMEKMGRFVGTMGGFLVLCALTVSIVSLSLQDEILKVMNTPAESYQGALEYSTVCMVGLVFVYGYNAVSAILRGMGDSKHPFMFIGIAAVMNVILDIVFVIFCGMGARGAALATVMSQAVSFIACTLFLVKNRHQFQLDIRLKDFVLWDKGMLKNLVKLGIPMAFRSAAIQFSKLFVNSWINSYGVVISAFAGIANKVSSISNLVFDAMNTAGATMVSQNIAGGKFVRVKKILLRLVAISLSVAAVISLCMVLFPEAIFRLFTDDRAVLGIVDGYIPIAVLLFFGSALRCSLNALNNGSGSTLINYSTAILDGIILRVGLSMVFGLVMDMRHYGFWLGDAVAGFAPFVIGIVFYFSGRWKKPRLK